MLRTLCLMPYDIFLMPYALPVRRQEGRRNGARPDVAPCEAAAPQAAIRCVPATFQRILQVP